MTPQVKPLSHRHRNFFFYGLVGAFFLALPFLFLYATGYRLNLSQSTLLSTGGLYIAAERTGAQIYIDEELVRETRAFRRAFYSQGLIAKTHRVHVQKEGHHTWVKELPVYPHLVTEAQAFNLPIVPQVRIISPWQTDMNEAVLLSTSTVLEVSEVTNQYLIESDLSTSTLKLNTEFDSLIELFTKATSTKTSDAAMEDTSINRARSVITSLTSDEETLSTTTKEWRGVRLYQDAKQDVYATFVGSDSQMPYYYCAEDFPRYQPTATSSVQTRGITSAGVAIAAEEDLEGLPLEMRPVSLDIPCDPTIKIDTNEENVTYFDFFPNNTDLVVLAQDSGIYVVEIDDRAWQNRQVLLSGENLKAVVLNGSIYIYDGEVIYQILIDQSWF